MSWQAVRWVLRNAKTGSLSNRVVLIVLADHANRNGEGARPSVKTISQEAEISERQAHYCLRSLEQSGHIQRLGKESRGVSVWSVVMDSTPAESAPLTPAESAPLQNLHTANGDIQPLHDRADKRSLKKEKSANALQKPAEELFEHWKAVWGHPRAILTSSRTRLVASRIRDGYDVETLRAAIDGSKADVERWPQRAEYGAHTFDLILRDATHIEKFAALANGVNGHRLKPGQPGFQPVTGTEREAHRAALRAARGNQ